ncbi:hypothetical protein HYW55_00830 [Candidatus Gottesmanbacteria bacterium]|nr:hypothetical protein [Candidatus Gottesmanbacteria bacterium]
MIETPPEANIQEFSGYKKDKVGGYLSPSLMRGAFETLIINQLNVDPAAPSHFLISVEGWKDGKPTPIPPGLERVIDHEISGTPLDPQDEDKIPDYEMFYDVSFVDEMKIAGEKSSGDLMVVRILYSKQQDDLFVAIDRKGNCYYKAPTDRVKQQDLGIILLLEEFGIDIMQSQVEIDSFSMTSHVVKKAHSLLSIMDEFGPEGERLTEQDRERISRDFVDYLEQRPNHRYTVQEYSLEAEQKARRIVKYPKNANPPAWRNPPPPSKSFSKN